ncbi:serine hydrolase domain-containing protein [Paenibacillus sp. HB172176]|uniref:serine hydrolase domain-containing protein n=1 Tax=Paenibacillus sp. HB172176 TaxID=2493690 RepID=UPI00143934BB|nr:serine hydrolase domain-containing protein [Paenibacillus sp. HB172176]
MGTWHHEKIKAFIEEEIDRGHLPGAALLVSCGGEELLREVYGSRAIFPDKAPMRIDTVFDLASLTKVVATLPAALRLMDQGKVTLSDDISAFLNVDMQIEGEPVLVRHLLTHSSGLRADLPGIRSEPELSREELLGRIRSEQLVHRPGTKVVYSDIGMILLGLIIEEITGDTLDAFVKKELYEPLEMAETGFRPAFEESRYAATEYSELHKAYKIGLVHDEKAGMMGGVSGHAGLFSTIGDLANYAEMIRQKGEFKGRRVLSRAAIELSSRSFTPSGEEGRGLGWQLASEAGGFFFGDYASRQAFGHTGFTGTSLLFDPERDAQIILLTNRVHFGRTDHIRQFRPRLHNLILSQL